jgi:hypothetical protein
MRILCAQVQNVVPSLRRMAKRRELSKQRAGELERICGYLRCNAHRMAYDEYLAAGYPISSGVIEGACRRVVNDRMQRSGMRWILEGAHAMFRAFAVSRSAACGTLSSAFASRTNRHGCIRIPQQPMTTSTYLVLPDGRGQRVGPVALE